MLSVRYAGARVSALDGVSFDVPRGAMTAVAGPNGSGKSTLVRALLRRQPLLSGSITIDGDNIATISQRELARRVAIAPQREEAAFPMRVDEYVALGRFPRLGLWESPSAADREAWTARFIGQECRSSPIAAPTSFPEASGNV
jgi:iron complex transport system ATP-binding protein